MDVGLRLPHLHLGHRLAYDNSHGKQNQDQRIILGNTDYSYVALHEADVVGWTLCDDVEMGMWLREPEIPIGGRGTPYGHEEMVYT